MELREALGLRTGECVAVVGAGGKTTLCWRLAQELAKRGERVVFTTTTKIWQPAEGAFDRLHIGPTADFTPMLNAPTIWRTACLASIIEGAPDATPVDDAGMPTVRTKLAGFAPDVICTLKNLASPQRISILVEADGARGLRIKAPEDNEPVIPPCADAVCVLANLDAIGRSLDERTAHRVDHIARLTQTMPGSIVTAPMMVALLTHSEGGLKGIPSSARKLAVLTQHSKRAPHPDAAWIMTELCRRGFDCALAIAPWAAQSVILSHS